MLFYSGGRLLFQCSMYFVACLLQFSGFLLQCVQMCVLVGCEVPSVVFLNVH